LLLHFSYTTIDFVTVLLKKETTRPEKLKFFAHVVPRQIGESAITFPHIAIRSRKRSNKLGRMLEDYSQQSKGNGKIETTEKPSCRSSEGCPKGKQ